MRQPLCVRTFIQLAAVGLLLVAAGGCETLSAPSINLLSTRQEVQLGRELAGEIEQQEVVHEDEQLQEYVQDIGRRLAGVARRRDMEYRFTVIDEPDTVNAFALPGGHMYLYTALMKLVRNEAELAGVMAHEIGHVAARHHGERLTRVYGYNLLMRVLLGDDPGAAANIASNLVEMNFSRENEREADAIAVEMLWGAGYDPGAMLTFMEKMREEEQRQGTGPRLPILSSHPATQERIALLRQHIARYPAEERARRSANAAEYRKQVLNRLP
ncbi:MAG: M48 family metallopeptidase [Candidatus Hydrogenedentota bacterium]